MIICVSCINRSRNCFANYVCWSLVGRLKSASVSALNSARATGLRISQFNQLLIVQGTTSCEGALVMFQSGREDVGVDFAL